MQRRSFLKLTGGLCGSAVLGLESSFVKAGPSDAAGERVFMDKSRLYARNQNRSTVVCQNGIVCASQPLASMAGVDILKAGGNAIDAAVCANAVLSNARPQYKAAAWC